MKFFVLVLLHINSNLLLYAYEFYTKLEAFNTINLPELLQRHELILLVPLEINKQAACQVLLTLRDAQIFLEIFLKNYYTTFLEHLRETREYVLYVGASGFLGIIQRELQLPYLLEDRLRYVNLSADRSPLLLEIRPLIQQTFCKLREPLIHTLNSSPQSKKHITYMFSSLRYG